MTDIVLRALAPDTTLELYANNRRIFQVFRYWRIVTPRSIDSDSFSKMEKRALFSPNMFKFMRTIYRLFARGFSTFRNFVLYCEAD